MRRKRLSFVRNLADNNGAPRAAEIGVGGKRIVGAGSKLDVGRERQDDFLIRQRPAAEGNRNDPQATDGGSDIFGGCIPGYRPGAPFAHTKRELAAFDPSNQDNGETAHFFPSAMPMRLGGQNRSQALPTMSLRSIRPQKRPSNEPSRLSPIIR